MAAPVLEITLTILDLPEILALLEEALDAVPRWQQPLLRERLRVILDRAQAQRRRP